MLDKLGDEIKKEIKEHALDEFPKECCGLIVPKDGGYKIVKCRNLFNSENKFFIDPDIFNHYDNRNFTIVYHSHTHEKYADFSEEDKLTSNKIKKDFLMYNVINDEFKYYEPKDVIIPILNRIFFPPIFDCATLVVDYYKQILNIDFKIKNHTSYYLNGHFEDFFIDNGFKEVKSVRKHDIILNKNGASSKHVFCRASIVNSDNTLITYGEIKIGSHPNKFSSRLYQQISEEKNLNELKDYKLEKIIFRHASLL